MAIDVTDQNFVERIIKKSKEIPIVVDFWAKWCQPCLILGPILEGFEKKLDGKFILAKVNVDDAPKMSEEYKIESIPNVKMIKNGKVADEFIGSIPESNVEEWLNKNLNN
jgi:putative thioredoxin